MAIKLDPVDLMIYADVAQAFEGWLIQNPEDKDEPKGITQSRVFAKSYLNLYVTFLRMMQFMPKESVEYESTTDEGVKRKYDSVDEIYVDLQKNTSLSNTEKELIEESITKIRDKVKPTLH